MNQDKLDRSLAIVQEAATRAAAAGTPLFVNFSGGKDSSCVLLLGRMITPDVEAIYMESGIELPGTIDQVVQEAERQQVKLHRTNPVRDYQGDFVYWVRKTGFFPNCGTAWCSSRLKLRPARAYLRKHFGLKEAYRINGVRRSESSRRSKIYRQVASIVPDGEMARAFIVTPILEWTSSDVMEFLTEHNFEIHQQYNQFSVSGCAYCPFYQVEIFQRILAVHLHIYDQVIQLEEELGKPAAAGRNYIRDIRNDFIANREAIMERLKAPRTKRDHQSSSQLELPLQEILSGAQQELQ